MGIAYGVSWEDSKKRWLVAMLTGLLLGVSFSYASPTIPSAGEQMISVIVRELPGMGSAPEQLVEELGGSVELELGIINGFSAQIPRRNLAALESSDLITSVTPNRPIKMLGKFEDGVRNVLNPGSMLNTANAIKARHLWAYGYTGQGVDVAVIDTGVSPVQGLDAPNKIKLGTDISFEQGAENLRFFDTNGHGTHMAGIIAGKDQGSRVDPFNVTDFLGIAPDAGIVNVKVGNATGATDVSQVIAGIDYVVSHRNANGLNIRVLNLSFGTDGTQLYTIDPLAYAAEVAWRSGIVVVAAAGNGGFGTNKLNNPAYDPFIIAVGASDSQGTLRLSDDTVPEFSERGDGNRNPDFVAPGKSILSLRVPGSHIDQMFGSTATVAQRYFKGTGTSQAAAAASGGAALLLSHRPNLTPDQVKYLMKSTAAVLSNADPQAQGAGLLDLRDAARAPVPTAAQSTQNFTPSDGSGSLELARGSLHVQDPDGNVLTGEKDIFGNDWSGVGWSGVGWSGVGWSGVGWSGVGWSGVGWSGVGWSGVGWSGVGWSGVGWSGVGWSGVGWSGVGWSGVGWSGVGWSGVGWSGVGWSGVGWSGVGWSGVGWSGVGWS